MRKYNLLPVLFALLGAVCALNAEPHPARGVVLQVGKSHRSVVVSCDAISGYMDPMEMSFTVSDAKALAAITPGTTISFTIVERGRIPSTRSIFNPSQRPILNRSRWRPGG